jgi:hypothetical protein
MQTATITLPNKVYRRPHDDTAGAGKTEQKLAAQNVETSLPPLMDTIPPRFRGALRAMEKLAIDESWTIARSVIDEKSQKKLRRLLKKNTLGTLTESECENLEELSSLVDLVTLRKGYALLLLKRRGQRIPSLAELEMRHEL